MRKILLALVVVLAMALAPVGSFGATGSSSGGDATVAKKKCGKKCKAKRKKRKCLKKAKTKKAKKKCSARKKAKKKSGGTPSVYNGRATSPDGTFKYGAVRIDRSGSKVTRVEIKDVTASCDFPGGLRVIVFNSSSPDHQILSGGPAIKGGATTVRFRPEKTVENDVIDLGIKFSGKTATGAFTETGVCDDAGVFKATG